MLVQVDSIQLREQPIVVADVLGGLAVLEVVEVVVSTAVMVTVIIV